MFKIKQTATYFWPVTVSMPIDGGTFDKSTFDAEFKRMTLDELKVLTEGDDEGENAAKAIMVGWKGVIDDDGNEVKYSETNRDLLLAWPTARAALLNAFRDSISGAPRKN